MYVTHAARSVRRTITLALLTLGAPAIERTAGAQDSTSRSIEERLDALDQRVRVLDRLREIARDSIAALARPSVVVAGRDGFSLRSADGAFQVRFRAYLQTDARTYTSIGATPATSSFIIRRARPIFEATLYNRVDVRIMPDFGVGSALLYEAYGDIRFWPQFVLRAGKFKPAIGLERLQSATDIAFAERGLPTGLISNRDVGFQLSGEIQSSLLAYQVGVFNGTPDLALGDGDASNSKDLAARLFLQPFVRTSLAPTIDFGIGVGASRGNDRGTTTAPAVSNYRSAGQLTVFQLRNDGTAAGTVVADGVRRRLVPQGYLNVGSLGLLSEYATSTQHVRLATAEEDLTARAWQLSGRWFLTGERASYRSVTPKNVFDPDAHSWGAWEIVARYGVLTPDADAFPLYANPATAIREEKVWGAGLVWHLARNTKIATNYERTAFTGGTATGDRDPETFVVTRVQVAF